MSGSAGQVTYWIDSVNQGGSNDHFWDTTYNRVGIGTDSPQCRLHVLLSGSEVAVSVNDVAVFQNDADTDDLAYVRILAGSAGKAVLQFGYASQIGLQSIACDNYANKMQITAGSVGIGVAPNEKLEVSGKVRTNDKFNVNGTDGISQTISIVDRNGTTHRLVFTGGILTSYSTS